ncbi:MAG: S41 family peptidase [Fibrobacterota bacterium]
MFIDPWDTIALGRIRLPAETGGKTQDTTLVSDIQIHNELTAKFVILVDSMSASATELLTTALQTNRPDIPVLGCHTYGKARGQVMLSTPSNGLAKMTFMTLKTAQGVDYNEVGLIPGLPLVPGTDWLDAAYHRARVLIGSPVPKERAEVRVRSRVIELNRKLLGIRRNEPLPMVRF